MEKLFNLIISFITFLVGCLIPLGIFLVLIFIILSALNIGGDGEGIDADDLGIGSIIRLPVTMTDPIKGGKFNDKFVTQAWTDTGLLVTSKNSEGTTGVALSVSNAWYPFGVKGNGKECQLESCSSSNNPQCKILKDQSVMVVASSSSNEGCKLSNGQGIYLLFATNIGEGKYNNPNSSYSSAASPSSKLGFYTSHLGYFPTKDGNFLINKAWSCNMAGECQEKPIEQLIGSRIFIKLIDNYYPDNQSKSNNKIKINIKNGIYKPNFISTAIISLDNTLTTISYSLKNAILGNLQGLISTILILYISFSAFSFALGTLNVTYTELIMRIIKLGIITILTIPNNFIADQFLSAFKVLAETAANLITEVIPNLASLKTTTSGNFGKIGYLVAYENVINQLLSPQVHIKIMSLLFTIYFWLIPFLYLLILILFLIVIKALLLFITAYIQLAILIVVLPIIALTLLFQLTSNIFQEWLKYMANSAMLITVTVMGIGLCLSMIAGGLEDLLSYKVDMSWIFWHPNLSQVNNLLTADKYFLLLLKALLCYAILDYIPGLVDAFTNAQFAPTAGSFRALQNSILETGGEVWNKATEINNQYVLGKVWNKLGHDEYGKGGKMSKLLDRMDRDQTRLSNFYKGVTSKIDQIQSLAHDDSLVKLTDKFSAQEVAREKALIKSEMKFNQYEQKLKEKSYGYISENTQNITFTNKEKESFNINFLNKNLEDKVMINNKEYKVKDIYDSIASGDSLIDNMKMTEIKYYDPANQAGLNKPSDDNAAKALDLQKKLRNIKIKRNL